MIKKIVAALLLCAELFITTSCGTSQELLDTKPNLDQMRAICELSVSECYYHNVAKFFEEDAGGILWWQKDKRFWIEYGATVTLGIDVSLVTMDMNGNKITITLPEAKVLDCIVNDDELYEESYVVDKNSVKVKAEDEIEAFDAAQKKLAESVSTDTTLLHEAQERAKALLINYIKNIGEATGKDYSIRWVYVDSDGTPLKDQPADNKDFVPQADAQSEETNE